MSRCSTAHGAETRGHAGISVLCPCPQQKQHKGQRRCRGVPESEHTAQELWLCRCGAGAGKACSRVRERISRAGTDLSKISCSALWGQGEKESSHLQSQQKNTPNTANPGLGSSVPLPEPHKPPLTPTPALGRNRSIQDPFSSAAALPNSENEWEWLKAIHCTFSWGTACCPLSVPSPRAGCRNSLCSQQTTPGLTAKEGGCRGFKPRVR